MRTEESEELYDPVEMSQKLIAVAKERTEMAKEQKEMEELVASLKEQLKQAQHAPAEAMEHAGKQVLQKQETTVSGAMKAKVNRLQAMVTMLQATRCVSASACIRL